MANENEVNKQVDENQEVSSEVVEQVEVKAEDVLYPDKDVEDKKVEAEVKDEPAKEVETEEKKEESQSESSELKLVIPEGSSLTDEDVKEVKAFAEANKLSPESAQKLLDEKSSFVSKVVEKQNADFKVKTSSWLEEVKKIPTFDEDLKHTQQVLNDWFDPDFKKMLNESGLGNHPSLFKGLAKLGKAMNPKKLVAAPKNQAAPVKQDYELFYGPDEKSG